MTTTVLAAYQTGWADYVLRKLSELSPQKRNMDLAMCSFFIDGMNVHEQMVLERTIDTGATVRSSA